VSIFTPENINVHTVTQEISGCDSSYKLTEDILTSCSASAVTPEWIVRQRVTTRFAALPNIVLGREMLPEAIFSRDATPDNLARLLEPLLIPESAQRRQQVVDYANRDAIPWGP
jgi:hypothetical protein